MSHPLSTIWKLYCHLPTETSWDVDSYILMTTFTTVEDALSYIEILPAACVQKCMFFLMRGNIPPIWEDPKNRKGGYFSYKVLERHIYDVWVQLALTMMGGSVGDSTVYDHINGMSISPKKKFSILKIWMKDASILNSDGFSCNIKYLPLHGCLFTPHKSG